MRNIAFLKNYLFPKCSFSDKVVTMQKHLPWKSGSFLDVFILNRETQLFRKVTAIKNFSFSRSGCSVEFLFRKRSYSEKVTAATLKQYLLRKCNYCIEVVTLKKCERVTSPKIVSKVVLKKSQHTREGKSLFEKKKTKNKKKHTHTN